MFVSISEIPDFDVAIFPAVTSPQMRCDPLLCRLRIGVIAVVENHLLDVAEDGLHRVIVRAPLGQAHPVQPQPPHLAPRPARDARVRAVLVESDPHGPGRVPAAYLPHKEADVLATLARQVAPAGAPAANVVEQEEVELATRPLLLRQHQPLRGSPAPPAVGFDKDRLDIEEEQHAPFG